MTVVGINLHKEEHELINITTNPIGWIFGFYGVSLSIAMSNHFAFRGDGNVFSVNNWSGYEIGASISMYPRRVYNGVFLEPGLVFRKLEYNYNPAMVVGPEIMLGWHWKFGWGFNIAAALGATYSLTENIGRNRVQPAGYFRIGCAF